MFPNPLLQGDKEHQVALPGVNAVNWLEGGSRYTLKYWRSKNPTPTREESIAEKYAGIWLRKVETSRKQRKPRDLSNQDWLRLLLFAPSSRAVRETVCGVLENLCKVCLFLPIDNIGKWSTAFVVHLSRRNAVDVSLFLLSQDILIYNLFV